MNFKKIRFGMIRHFILYIYVFSLPFDSWDEFRFVGSLANSNVLGFLYIILSMIKPKSFFAIDIKNNVFISLVILWLWLFLSNSLLFFAKGYDFNFIYLFSYTQMLIMFWLVSNDINSNSKVRVNVYLSFLLSVLTVFLFIKLGLGIQASKDTSTSHEIEDVLRVWFFGMNPNSLGNLSAISIMIAIGLFLESKEKQRYLLIFLLMPFLSLLSLSGSAGAVLALMVGFIVYLFYKKESILLKLGYYILGLFFVLCITYYISENDYLYGKLFGFLSSGSTTGRVYIWMESLKVYADSPIFGFGFTGGESGLYSLTGLSTAHNVFLDVLLWGGIVGFLLYISFYFFVFKEALKTNKFYSSPLQVSIFSICLFLALKSGGGFFIKYIWLLLACSASPVSNVVKNHRDGN